jgi:hypothetical protein
MGNFSRDPVAALNAALANGYSRVRFQQGKPILDRELNLAVDLASCDRLAQQYIGDGVPAGNQGFQITTLDVPGNNFTISAGRCLVAGGEVVLANPTTYKGQPNTGNVAALPAGVSNVYLRVFPSEITSAQDPDLNNSGDVGVETSVREEANWEVVVSVAAVNAPDHFLLAVIDTGAKTITDQRRVGLTLSAVKDEVAAARGSAATLGARLNTNDQAVTAVQTEVTTARGSTAQLGARLSASLADDGTIKPGTVSVQKMASTLVLNAQFSVAAAPAAGQTTQQPVSLVNADDPGFFLVSVHFDGPRGAGPIQIPLTQVFDWQYRVMLFKPQGSPVFNQHLYQIVIENPNTFAISVTVKAYRLAET